jgi:hypothetical protein
MEGQENQLVRQSRAGDAFHYRWAARRCLRLVETNAPLRCVVIEGSKESKQAGEYSIDVAEYSSGKGGETIAYFQLKHSTVRTAQLFSFSEFEPTLREFAKRHAAAFLKAKKPRAAGSVTYSLVTNRPISDAIKQAVRALAAGSATTHRRKLERATKLKAGDLKNFCAAIMLEDGQGNYVVQRHQLHCEMAGYFAGAVDSNEVDALIALVTDRALPNSNGEIYREHVLQKLGVTSMLQLFPAERRLEQLAHPIKREQHDALVKQVLKETAPIIVHAPGGVGKSVVACQVAVSLPPGSWGVVYDCFGAGNYRNPSEPRHLARSALVQMANEMAVVGLCRPLVTRRGDTSDDLFRAFIERVKQAVAALRLAKPKAVLALLVDAADNAEMAAAETSDQCFAHNLLREPLPDGCRLLMFCRTERIDLLQPRSNVHRFALQPFSQTETEAHLRNYFPAATSGQALELHRLTGGNPRVQANALAPAKGTVVEVLSSLGPSGTTVDDQIAAQLESAVTKLKDQHPANAARQVDAICLGLANLPPYIPLDILAQAAGVNIAAIKSFVSDLGRPLWLSDESVQFRDEPTETWFRQKFGADKNQILTYLGALGPLAVKSAYAAKALPQLLHRAGEHRQLVELALSDERLPTNNPVDARNIRVYRLQFAFKAGLSQKRLGDACRLAFRAGEEVAGDQRQVELLGKNVDLIHVLQSTHRVQELVYTRVLRSGWDGSENVYAAALLSSVDAFKGEARGYLRGANRWLGIYFAERKKREKTGFGHGGLAETDVAELGWAHFNLFGPAEAVRYFTSWKPPEYGFRVARLFIRRLVDASQFAAIDEIARLGAKHHYLILALVDELIAVSRFPAKESLRPTLEFLAKKNSRIEKAGHYSYEDLTTPAVVSLCEAATARRLPRATIRSVLEKYTVPIAGSAVGDNFEEKPRRLFLRGAALRAVLNREAEPKPESFLAKKDAKQGRTHEQEQADGEIVSAIGALLPWYFLRARFLAHDPTAESVDLAKVTSGRSSFPYRGYRTHDRIPYEASVAKFEVLAVKGKVSRQELEHFATDVIASAEDRFYLKHRVPATRTAFRQPHLEPLRERLEQSCRKTMEGFTDSGPEERADWYVNLARAVLPTSPLDAAAYFSRAVEAVSKFGDEVVDRWQAVLAVARRGAAAGKADALMGYRFIRCGEIVGEAVQREKYWERDEVFQVAVGLHPSSALAGISRWRDRTVGTFGSQLYALATEAVEQRIIPPAAAWSLSGFSGCNGSGHFASHCVACEPDAAKRAMMLGMALWDLELVGSSAKDLLHLETVAAEFPAEKSRLAERLAVVRAAESAKPDRHASLPVPTESRKSKAVDRLLRGVDVLDAAALERATSAMHTMDPPREFEIYWNEVLALVPAGREARFLLTFPKLGSTSFHDGSYIINSVRRSWLRKAAVERDWLPFLTRIGKRYAIELANSERLSYWSEHAHLTDPELAAVRDGFVEGLAESLEFVGASTYFGFVCSVAKQLPPDEALGLLDFSIGRFELHVSADFGDGAWADWLQPPNETAHALAGMIWSALGSPYSSTRWEAAHAVRRLAELGCRPEISALIGWMRQDEVGAFGSKRYPFYVLHARLYLLIALARAALECAGVLRPHHLAFASVALEGLPHVLIQKNAADIALRIEQALPGTYDAPTLAKLRQVGVSPLPLRLVKGSGNQVDTPWHAQGKVDLNLTLGFDSDFDRYWFDQVGTVFGVPDKQVEDLAREVAAHQLGIPTGEKYGYRPDPRSHQWDSGDYYERGTMHSHGSYPRNDTHRFYYSYHSFIGAASRLLAEVPVVRHTDRGYVSDEWADWLHRHSLTRRDGRWLADRRDPAPITRRSWVNDSDRENWRWQIHRADFVDVLVNQAARPGFICVDGYWTECVYDRIENLRVRTALVSRETAGALATSLRLARDAHDFRFPSYGNDDGEFTAPPFELIGWILDTDGGDRRLDQFDPLAKEIAYPPDEVGEPFAATLGLSPDYERRGWCKGNTTVPSVVTEIWSQKGSSRREEPFRAGHRMSASVDLLKELCVTSGKDLIICVEIERRVHRDYRSGTDEDSYLPVSHNVFLLSADGLLRDETTSHQLS